MRALVHSDISHVMSDIDAAGKTDPGIMMSSNPFTYTRVSPYFARLVARGEPALDAIAEEIEASPEDGLREYLLAIAGQTIAGDIKRDASWSTGKGWALYYRSRP
jgi:hypothetical protein